MCVASINGAKFTTTYKQATDKQTGDSHSLLYCVHIWQHSDTAGSAFFVVCVPDKASSRSKRLVKENCVSLFDDCEIKRKRYEGVRKRRSVFTRKLG